MELNGLHALGFALALGLLVLIGVLSGRRVAASSDFSVGGGRSGVLLVTGAVFGTMTGGATTIGTAQGAFSAGLYGIWWCVGLIAGCLILAFFCVGPIKRDGCTTMQELIGARYGKRAAVFSAVLSSVGVLLSVVSQQLAATSLFVTLLGVPVWAAAALTTLLMLCYVLFGGMLGAGAAGLFKAVLLVLIGLACTLFVLPRLGGLSGELTALPRSYFSLHTGGLGLNLGSVASVALGAVCSQLYFQTIASARNAGTARAALLISALLVVPAGTGMVLAGFYMRLTAAATASASALPAFLLANFPPVFAGIALATLLITIIGSGAGVALGIATVITTNIYEAFVHGISDRTRLRVTRIALAGVLVITGIMGMTNVGSLVLKWTFLSFALRSAINLVPVLAALFTGVRVGERYALVSMLAGGCSCVAAEYLLPGVDSLFFSVPFALIPILLGARRRREI